MIKTKQKTFQKDKSNNNNISSNSQRILKMESKKLIEQKNSSNPNTIHIKTTKNDKDSKFPRKRTNNSISSKGCTNLNLQRRLRRGKLNTNKYKNISGADTKDDGMEEREKDISIDQEKRIKRKIKKENLGKNVKNINFNIKLNKSIIYIII